MFSKLQYLVIGIGSISLALATSQAVSAQSLNWLGRPSAGQRMPAAIDDQYPLFSDPLLNNRPNTTHVDYDAYLSDRVNSPAAPARFISPRDDYAQAEAFHQPGGPTWQLLPEGLVYDTYLAGTKEPRFALQLMSINSDGCYFAGFLGARVPLLRYGTTNSLRPEGFQIDADGLAHVRVDFSDDWEVDAADFRGGLSSSYGYGRHRIKFGYYHLSSHVQDEFLAANPGFTRLNFSRDALVLGLAYYLTDKLRVYGEAGYAFVSDVSQPWEFQFGLDYAPVGPTGIRGAPFFAVNGHLREEVNFGGTLTTQLGWAWVGDTGKMVRMGLHYYNGESNQFSFYDDFEQQLGFGVWYDF